MFDVNRPVPIDQIVDRVWGTRKLPRNPHNAVRTYISLLKRSLSSVAGAAILRRNHSYTLEVSEKRVDWYRFRSLVASARSSEPSDSSAVTLYEQALALWRGAALSDLDTPWADCARRLFDAERGTAESELVDAQLLLGRHGELLSTLAARCAASPLDERLAGQLMLALFRAGRQADALHHYHRLRRQLSEELGVEPGNALRRLYEHVLVDHPILAVPSAQPAQLSPGATHPAVVRQLPAGVQAFVGRRAEMSRLDGLLPRPPGETAATEPIAAVAGMAGVGKTALALRWAHRVAHHFPDGQLYVDLYGFSGAGKPHFPGDVIRDFLVSLGISRYQIPSTLDGQAALYRSVLAGRRILVLLDNARDYDQIRPLLPGTSTAFTLVTSRNHLTSLVAMTGAHSLTLSPLTEDEAREFIFSRLGNSVSENVDAVERVVSACAGIPLALSIVAARARQSGFSLELLAGELDSAGRRLDFLDGGDSASQMRAAFSWSFAALTEPAARLFGALAARTGSRASAAMAADAADVSEQEARRLLGELTRASLLTEDGLDQYVCNDLLLQYAREASAS